MIRSISQRRRRGFTLFYAMFAMVALCAIASLAVDYGRVQLAKAELRRAADAAARAGAAGLLDGTSQATRLAKSYASSNRVDTLPLDLRNQDISFVNWDSATGTYQTLSGWQADNANAVRIVARRGHARENAIPTMFASVIGFDAIDISAESIALLIPPVNVDQYVPATANPFLAGMPAGSVASLNNPHNSPDYAGTSSNPRQSPLAVNMNLTPGQTLTFDSIDGTARHDPNLPYFNPDGELSDIGHNTNRDENGIADVVGAPINSLVGVFLGPDRPDDSPAPSRLDFTTDTQRNFNTLTPQLKQIFFIGDGLDSNGNRQQFIVPPGATRLYLATWDFFEWNNNAGYRNIKVIRPMQIKTVR
jgi:Flp pilus assembly protein TadG